MVWFRTVSVAIEFVGGLLFMDMVTGIAAVIRRCYARS